MKADDPANRALPRVRGAKGDGKEGRWREPGRGIEPRTYSLRATYPCAPARHAKLASDQRLTCSPPLPSTRHPRVHDGLVTDQGQQRAWIGRLSPTCQSAGLRLGR